MRTFLADNGLDAKAYLAARRGSSRRPRRRCATSFGRASTGSSAKLYRDLYDLSRELAPERRRDLLVRYLGFPLWDVLLFPIQALADAGENDGVQVQRMSPYEATVLSTRAEGQGARARG